MSILSLSCSNKPVEKEMKMPMLFDTKEQAEKEANAPYFRSTVNQLIIN